MRRLILAVLLALVLAPKPAQAQTVELLTAWVVTVAVAAFAGAYIFKSVGDAYEQACTGAGGTYARDPSINRWACKLELDRTTG